MAEQQSLVGEDRSIEQIFFEYTEKARGVLESTLADIAKDELEETEFIEVLRQEIQSYKDEGVGLQQEIDRIQGNINDFIGLLQNLQ